MDHEKDNSRSGIGGDNGSYLGKCAPRQVISLFHDGSATVRPKAGFKNRAGIGSLDAKNDPQLGLNFSVT